MFILACDKSKIKSLSLNLSYFIAKRISQEQKEGFSSAINTIAIVTIAIGLSAAIVSFLIMQGFQKTIKDKIYSFGSLAAEFYNSSEFLNEFPR